MNKQEIIEQLVSKAKELDEQGLYKEADAVHEQLRIANQADNWQNFLNGAGEFMQWANPVTGPMKGFQAAKDWIDPAFAGLHDNTGAFQNALVQLADEIKNSSINDLYKSAISQLMNQAIQSSKQMNADYFAQNHPEIETPQQVPQQNVSQQAPQRIESRDEIMRRIQKSSIAKFRHVEAQQQVDDAKSLYSKANAMLQEYAGIIKTNTPGFQDTLAALKQVVESLRSLAAQEQKNNASAQQGNTMNLVQQIQVAQGDPAVQSAVKAYILYGLKFGQDKMFAALNANAQLADIKAFQLLVQNAWKPEYQTAWEEAYYKNHPQPLPDWYKNLNKPQQFNLPQVPQMPSFQAPPGFDQFLNSNKR